MIAPSLSTSGLLLEHYWLAKAWTIESGYQHEIDWQAGINFENLTEREFLREYAWVVLNSGFREATVRKYFDYISLSFCDWDSAREIVSHREKCIIAASQVFGNQRKLAAIVQTAELICSSGFEHLKQKSFSQVENLTSLPYIGSVTCWHLAKNIGLNYAKPDRHLVRMATKYGYRDVHAMCAFISRSTGDTPAVADLVLWRYAASAKPRVGLRNLNS